MPFRTQSRELDPRFSIADANEGLTQITIEAHDLIVTPQQWNQVVGQTGVMSMGRKIRSNLVHSVKFRDNGSTYNYGDEGITIDGGPTFQVNCPNVYMFCLSQKEIPPQDIEGSYDSQYFIEDENISEFAGRVASSLLAAFTADHIDSDESEVLFEAPLSCTPILRSVSYVADQKLILRNSADFQNNFLIDKIQTGMFEKHEDHFGADEEYRILFPITHPEVGLIPVIKKAALLEIDDNVRSLLSS